MKTLLTLLVTSILLSGTYSCKSVDGEPEQKCRTYFTLSADKTKLTWHHTCPPNLVHMLLTAEKEIQITQWHEGANGMLIAEGKDIRIPRHPSNVRPEGRMIGQIVCSRKPDRVEIALSVLPQKDKAYSYRRNGVYELVYEE
jgi:hypothetical protein